MNTENENQNISFEEEEENNADIRANRLLTVVNHAYDGKEIVGRDSFHHRSKNNVKAYDYFK